MNPLKWGCLAVATVAFFLCLYIDRYNEVTELRLTIPQLEKELRELTEANLRLAFDLQRFASPEHLLKLKAERTDLKFPFQEEVWE